MVILFYSLLGVESAVKTGPPPGQGVGSMGCGLFAAVVIIDNDHGRRWGHHCHHRQSMVVVAGRSSSNQHRLWSSSSSTSTVVIIAIGINCGHHRRWPWSSSSESSPRARQARRRASSACRASNTSRGISRSCGRCCLPRAIVESGRGLEVNYRIDKSIEVGLRAVVALVRSQRCRSRSRSKSMGLNKLKQYGQAIVDNWPWPGGHSM